MKYVSKLLFICVMLYGSYENAITIDRVILGCDANPLYLEFWPVVARTWEEIVGIKPTLALIATADVKIDESLGDVIRFEPIEGIPTAFQAQVIRLLLPIFFKDEVCIISDMDMIPCQKSYFVDSVKDLPEDAFIVYKDGAFEADVYKEYPMCYNVARGSTFQEIFNVSSAEDINAIMSHWYGLGLGWTSDQQILYAALNNWPDKNTRLIKLGHPVIGRIDRAYWAYQTHAVAFHYYIDSHMLRPYSKYKNEIDGLVDLLIKRAE